MASWSNLFLPPLQKRLCESKTRKVRGPVCLLAIALMKIFLLSINLDIVGFSKNAVQMVTLFVVNIMISKMELLSVDILEEDIVPVTVPFRICVKGT